MKNVTIDLTNIQTPRGMHAYLEYMLDFPENYGRNLDALHDMLTEIGEPMLLTIRRPAALPPEMAKLFPKLALALHDVQQENDRLKIFIEIAE